MKTLTSITNRTSGDVPSKATLLLLTMLSETNGEESIEDVAMMALTSAQWELRSALNSVDAAVDKLIVGDADCECTPEDAEDGCPCPTCEEWREDNKPAN